MKTLWLLPLWGVLVLSLSSTHCSPSAASPLPANEYIPYHPTGCRFVRKNQDGSFSFVQPCIRPQRQASGMPGEWQQLIEASEMATPGVIFIPRQTLINELDVEGFWCSGAAPRAFADRFQECTSQGWQKAPRSP